MASEAILEVDNITLTVIREAERLHHEIYEADTWRLAGGLKYDPVTAAHKAAEMKADLAQRLVDWNRGRDELCMRTGWFGRKKVQHHWRVVVCGRHAESWEWCSACGSIRNAGIYINEY